MHAEHGCQDIDECQASGGKVCETNQFCMNLGQDHLLTSLACYHGCVTSWHFFVTEESNSVSWWSPIEGVRPILFDWSSGNQLTKQNVKQPHYTVGPNIKNTPKPILNNLGNWYVILVPASLTHFHMNWKRKLCKSALNCLKKSVKSQWVNLFSGRFYQFGTSVRYHARDVNRCSRL